MNTNDTSRFPAAFVAWKDEEGVVQVTTPHYSDGDFTEWVEEMLQERERIEYAFKFIIVNGSIGDSLLTLDSNEALLYICNSQEELDKAFAEAILVRCVEAVHINQEGDESCPYTWEVPPRQIPFRRRYAQRAKGKQV